MVINGMPDHIHLLIGLKPDCALSDLVRDIKANSSKWVNDNQLVAGKFEWQTGFAAFSVSQSGVKSVLHYILTQEEHHQKVTLKEEYIAFLEAYQIEFNPEYLPDWD